MKVGVISDTHDRLPAFRRALALLKRIEVEALFHAGDFVAPFAACLMSADQWTAPLYSVYGNNAGEREGLRAVLPGVVNDEQNGRLTLNPGECCGWVTDRCTVALLDLAALTAQIIEVHD